MIEQRCGVGGVRDGIPLAFEQAGQLRAQLLIELGLIRRLRESSGKHGLVPSLSRRARYHDPMSTVPQPQEEISALDKIKALESEYLLQNYARYPIALHRGRGCYAYDISGKRYLDLLTGIGVNSLGHAHPRLVKAIREQAGLLLHTSNLYYNEFQGPLAERLAKISGLQRTFFCNSGAESMEGAMKMIRAHGRKINHEKYEIIALHNSFHGRTFGALSITGQEKY